MKGNIVAALPFREPAITTVLILSSFLVLLNIVNFLLDNVIFCGLLGQLLLGMAWGTPGWQWLGTTFEEVVVKLGYLGLILLVYEGGLSTSFKALKANIMLSTVIALTGVIIPIGLSFILKILVYATTLQAFAAGVALCSTSLGTTLTIIGTSGLSSTPLGTVIIGAAMLDDIAGLVLVQVVSNLGTSGDVICIKTVLRPILVSVVFVLVVLLGCKYLVSPLTRQINGRESSAPFFAKAMEKLPPDAVGFVVHTVHLFTIVTGAAYAGTSPLFAAYVAGASISWWDEAYNCITPGGLFQTHEQSRERSEQERNVRDASTSTNEEGNTSSTAVEALKTGTQNASCGNGPCSAPTYYILPSGKTTYETYYAALVERLLKPLFFASVGFAIPITEMFDGEIVWRGLIYSILMAFSKLVTGVWLVRTGLHYWALLDYVCRLFSPASSWFSRINCKARKKYYKNGVTRPILRMSGDGRVQSDYGTTFSNPPRQTRQSFYRSQSSTTGSCRPQSLYPASITGLAMIARGEIGFLISSLAETKGIFFSIDSKSGGTSAIYLVVTWAIMLCTIIGPLALGALVQKVKRIQRSQQASGSTDPLGEWGVSG